jgi:type I restriction enzyme S subunit
MRAKDALMPELLPFIVNNEKFFDWAITHSAGGLSPRCKFKDLANYEFLLPPKEQQVEIAKLLWAMDEAVQNDRLVLSHQNQLFLSYSKSIFSECKGKPEALNNVGTLIMGQSPSGSTYNETGDGIPFLQGNAEFGKKFPIHTKYTTAPNKVVQKNTILISVRAPVGDLNIADKEYCIGRGLAGIYIENDLMRDYVYNFIKYAKRELETKSTGSTFKAINKDILSSLMIIVPKNKELIERRTILNSIISSIENLEAKLKNTKILQESIINQIF